MTLASSSRMSLLACSVGGESVRECDIKWRQCHFFGTVDTDVPKYVSCLLSPRFGTKRIKANQVYQEYIQERHHLHMNATRWVTLTEFVKHLGREGIVHVDENEKGWFVAWIDNSPGALKRQAALQKMERQKVDDEGRERKRLQEQIEKAKREEDEKQAGDDKGEGSSKPAAVEDGLRRDQGPIKLGIGLKASSKAVPPPGEEERSSGLAPSVAEESTSKLAFSISSSSSSSKPAATPFRLGVNPLKATSKSISPSNPLKSSASMSGSTAPSGTASKPQARTMAERIMQEEEERRQKRKSGPMPSGDGMKRIRM